ncbi:MAG: glycosyltransferase family 1 protein [Planctomycetes bacterium]|nr:glycosyltransferase family 1 protein [Planctomycetota bacterium]
MTLDKGLLRTFSVVPALPDSLLGLRDLANNLWWCWNADAFELFRRLDPEIWEEVNHNPVKLLDKADQGRIDKLAGDSGYVAAVERVKGYLEEYKEGETWFAKTYPDLNGTRIAYFSAEFGITECLAIYSGGLGVLAGDHLKSASDLGLPIVGVGLLYRQGYFRQYLSTDGWQQEFYPELDFYNLPVELEKGEDGKPVTIDVGYPGRKVRAQVWRAQVGRIPLFLLDANLKENSPADRNITAQLYGGDLEMRISQEILLGIGGVQALMALGIHPEIYHMNEGHSAFLGLERVRLLMNEHKVSFKEASEAVAGGNVFTTHTPVPAGNDVFSEGMMAKYFLNYSQSLGLTWNEFMALGRQNPVDQDEPFCLTVLALKLAAGRNGVSQLHGKVSRAMWHRIWHNVPQDEVPIEAITNGVHTRTWLSYDMATLFHRYLDPEWAEKPADHSIWEGIDNIPDGELWRTHERRRERLVAVARARLRMQLTRRGAGKAEVERAEEVLDPEALTIGFARRFATYKRATLLFRDIKRLQELLNDKDRPCQIIFAGKAHPHDNEGKELIRGIVQTARQEAFRGRIVFLEDYDMSLSHYLASGVDVWLNTPRRPLEASGTSGMKIAVNGGLNMSVLDGWWCEGYTPDGGWAIGTGEKYENAGAQDAVESEIAYELLEKEVIPMFYERGPDGLPRKWIRMMKASMRTVCPMFNTNRMVQEYTERFYLPGIHRSRRLLADGLANASALAKWKDQVHKRWAKVNVLETQAGTEKEYCVGSELLVRAKVSLGEIHPDEVAVQIYEGPLTPAREIEDPNIVTMACENEESPGVWWYSGSAPCRKAGLHGFALRILPRHDDLASLYDTGLTFWA